MSPNARADIGGKTVGSGAPAYIVSEIGINHNGSVAIAKKLIDAAKEAGCDAVKFQKRTIPVVYAPAELERPREIPADIIVGAMRRGVLDTQSITRLTASHFQMTTNGDLKWALEFTRDEYRDIDAYCREKSIAWFASPWDEESVDFLEAFDPPCHKIASASLTDDGLLRHIRSKGRPIILSTGMSTLEEIDRAVAVLGKERLILLHCTSTYPSDFSELNLAAIQTLQNRYDIPIGYSGHEKGVYPSVFAVAHGACVVERHITLDRTMWGSDQAASLEPKGLRTLAKAIRLYETVRGDGIKRVYPSEIPIIKKLRRRGAATIHESL